MESNENLMLKKKEFILKIIQQLGGQWNLGGDIKTILQFIDVKNNDGEKFVNHIFDILIERFDKMESVKNIENVQKSMAVLRMMKKNETMSQEQQEEELNKMMEEI